MPAKTLKSESVVGIISSGRLVTGWKDSGRSEHLRTNVLLCSNMPAKILKSESVMEIISGGRLVTGWKRLSAFRTFEDKCSTLVKR